MRKQKQNHSRRRRVSQMPLTLFRAPQHSTPITITKTYRFISNSVTPSAITLLQLLAIPGVVNYSANTNRCLADSCKIHKIEIWTDAVVTNFIELYFFTQFQYTRPKEVTDECQSTAAPAHIVVRPPKGVMSEWLSAINATTASALNLFNITSSVGSVVDVTLSHSFWQQSQSTNPVVYSSTAAGTLGNIYYIGLDGTVGRYPPAELPTIV
jgi:hypothetical protein